MQPTVLPQEDARTNFPWEVLAALEESYLVAWISQGQFGFQYEKKNNCQALLTFDSGGPLVSVPVPLML